TLQELNTESVINTLHQKGITHLYLHFDFDCLEPSEYDKTYYQVADGLNIKESENCIKRLQQEFKVVGGSVLESVASNQKELRPIFGIINTLMN
ncbi:MAG: arginase family protein, partial [Bacteroidota bacterium]